MHVKLVAIDPGASGGLAWQDSDGVVHAENLPEGMTAIVDRFRALIVTVPGIVAVMEKVGYWMPGDHPNSAAKFARHCGQLESMLYSLGIPFTEIGPGVWMRKLGVLPKDKAERKRAIKELMSRQYPHIKVTLGTADALALLSVSIPDHTKFDKMAPQVQEPGL